MDIKAKKGQAAMEFLMTYGWAILVIVIVIGALYWYFQGLPQSDICRGDIGFVCVGGKAQLYTDGTNTLIALKVANGQQTTMTVKEIGCSINKAGITYAAPSETLTTDSGNTVNEVAPNEAFTIKGLSCPGAPTSGTFRGFVGIKYSLADDPNPDVLRETVISVSGNVVKSG